jgi:hypothetical protein
VLKSPEALWSSYDGTHLLYATFNDSEVGILNFPWFKTEAALAANKAAHRDAFLPRFQNSSISYGILSIICAIAFTIGSFQPGATNPTVQLWVLDISNLTDLQSHLVRPPQALVGQ